MSFETCQMPCSLSLWKWQILELLQTTRGITMFMNREMEVKVKTVSTARYILRIKKKRDC